MRLRSLLAAALVLLGSPARATGPVPHLNLLFDGDSISAGWGASPGNGLDIRVAAALGAGVRTNNVAVGGRPVYECLRLYPKLVAPLFEPEAPHNVLVFHAGDNDINAGRNAVQTYAAFTAYVAAAHQQGWKIVVSTELRRWDFPPPKEAELISYNRMLRHNTAAADAVVDFDADPRLRDRSYRSDPDLFTRDGVHPSDGGYAVLAGMIAPAVQRLAGHQTPPANPLPHQTEPRLTAPQQ